MEISQRVHCIYVLSINNQKICVNYHGYTVEPLIS